ncbi:MAG TPA: hypothetical protein VF556_09170 [Pyrinomonadaceae bacterium]|jgi:beta-lactam-binding protein with PASTA domain
MANINLDTAFVLLWSARTRSFHMESYKQMSEANVQAYLAQTGIDYICLGVFESAEIANSKAKDIEKQRNSIGK